MEEFRLYRKRQHQIQRMIETLTVCANPNHYRQTPRCNQICQDPECRGEATPEALRQQGFHCNALVALIQSVIRLELLPGVYQEYTKMLLDRCREKTSYQKIPTTKHVQELLIWVLCQSHQYADSTRPDVVLKACIEKFQLVCEWCSIPHNLKGVWCSVSHQLLSQPIDMVTVGLLQWISTQSNVFQSNLNLSHSWLQTLQPWCVCQSGRYVSRRVLPVPRSGSDPLTEQCAKLYQTITFQAHVSPDVTQWAQDMVCLDPGLRQIYFANYPLPMMETVMHQTVTRMIQATIREDIEFLCEQLTEFLQWTQTRNWNLVPMFTLFPNRQHALIDMLQSAPTISTIYIQDIRRALKMSPIVSSTFWICIRTILSEKWFSLSCNESILECIGQYLVLANR